MVGFRIFFSTLFITGILLSSFLNIKSSEAKINPGFQSFETNLNEFVKERTNNQVSHISVYFLDLSNNFSTGVNENYEYDISSLVKLPTMMGLFKKAQSDPQVLTKTIIFQGKSSDHLKPNISPTKELEKKAAYTVGELVERMIIFSDNQAYNLLLANIEGDIFKKVFADFGVNLPDGEFGQIRLSVKQYAAFLKALFNGSYLNKEMSEKALQLLMQVDFKNGIVALLPPNIKVAHKYGERSWDKITTKQLHDCGIIYYPNHPYLLCVMTRGYSFEAQSAVIKDLSSLVFNELIP